MTQKPVQSWSPESLLQMFHSTLQTKLILETGIIKREHFLDSFMMEISLFI